MDSKTLRQFVQQALNRGEAYHQLRRAIASINGNQFRGGLLSNRTLNGCARIIANCIIYYNFSLLSGLIEKLERENSQEDINMIENLSPGGIFNLQVITRLALKKNYMSLDILLENLDPLAREDQSQVAV